MDRRQALFQGQRLPERARGTVLSVDISGFTPLSETLGQTLGPRRGAEELTRQLDAIFGALIAEVDRYGGSVIGFSGDAIACWFAQDDGAMAVAAALAMQEAMQAFLQVLLPGGAAVSLGIKTAIANGPVRRMLVGDPNIQRIDVLAGHTLEVLEGIEKLAAKGQVLVSEGVVQSLGAALEVAWLETEPAHERVALVQGLNKSVEPKPWADLPENALSEAQVRQWILPLVYERLKGAPDQFLADSRPVAALFLSFGGTDYDEDEDAGILLDAYIRWVQATITRYEGSLLQLTFGDKGSYLYVAFGALAAHDDDAARAIQVALELLKPPPHLSYIQSVRIGIAMGGMYTGAYGAPWRRTFGALGDKTNLAARLMQQAEVGQILCDDDSYQQAKRRWAFDLLPPIRVKGKAGLIRVYAPTGQAALAGTEVSDKSGAMVGREGALSRIQTALTDLQAGKGKVFFIEGEAGIGKSRLIQELVRMVREQGITGLVGGGHSVEQQTPYRAWRDVFSMYFGLGGLTDPEERRNQVRQVVQEVAPKLLQRLPLLNDLLSLGFPDTPLTAALDPSLRQESLVVLLVQLLKTWTLERPLILVLEDAYWLDSRSWELALQVAQTLLPDDLPLLFILATRPIGENSTGAQIASTLKALPDSEVLDLASLDLQDIAALIASRLGVPREAVPAPLSALIREHCGGNPFFAEELIHTLRERGLVEVEGQDAPRCVVKPELFRSQSILPDTLQGLILSRIDRLPPDRQLTLKVAAVIGRNYPYPPLKDSLERLSALSEAVLSIHLSELIKRSLIMLETPEPRYAFKHAITYDVTYQSLLFAQRRQIHRILAEWYEQSFAENPEPVFPLLAHHWMHAAEGLGDASAVEKARAYLSKAGAQALQLCAYPEALQFLLHALTLLPGDSAAERARILVSIGIAHEKMADYAPAAGALEEAVELSRQASDLKTESQALAELSWIAVRKGEYPEAEQLGQQALELALQAGDKLTSAKAGYRLGIVAFYQGNYPLAARRFEQSLALSQELGDRYGVAGSLNVLGLVAVNQGDYATATRYFEEALAIAQELGNRDAVGKFLTNLGLVAEKQGDYPLAVKHYEDSLAILRETGSRHAALLNVLNLGDVATAQGNDTKAEHYYIQALAEAVTLGAMNHVLHTLRGIAGVLIRGGQPRWAANLLGLVLAHPASDAELRQLVEPELLTLRNLLSPERLEVVLAEGRELVLEEVVKELSTHGHEGLLPHARTES